MLRVFLVFPSLCFLVLSRHCEATTCSTITVSSTSHVCHGSLSLNGIRTGISPSTGLPFSPPIAFMHSVHVPHSKPAFKSKQERSRIEQGKCHKCNKWVPVEGVKDVEVKVSLGWTSFAPIRPFCLLICHHLVGEGDFLVEACCHLPSTLDHSR